MEGKLVRIDDFLVTVQACGRIAADVPQNGDAAEGCDARPAENSPGSARRSTADKDIHDVTAYLVTLK